MIRYTTSGDLGDATVSLNVAASLPEGPHTLLLEQSTVTKMRTPKDMENFERLFAPLALAQPYISECRIEKNGEHVDWRSGDFRGFGSHKKTETLFSAILTHLIATKGIGRGMTSDKPWLTATPSEKTNGRVVIARSDRYRNPYMPWAKIVEFYADRLIFIGTPNEHISFCNDWGKVEYLPTKDLLEVAEAIAGSLLFIGNQSSPMAVCEGLKHHSVQEVCLHITDCIYKRDNAQYCYNGAVTLPGFDKEDLVIPPKGIHPNNVSTQTSPPQGWQYGAIKGIDFGYVLTNVLNLPEWRGKTKEEAREAIINANTERVPHFFQSASEFSNVKRAIQSAGIV